MRGLGIHPVGVVDEYGKRRIVHHSAFRGTPEAEGGEHETTYWDQVPEYHLENMGFQIVRRILGPRDKFGVGGRLVL